MELPDEFYTTASGAVYYYYYGDGKSVVASGAVYGYLYYGDGKSVVLHSVTTDKCDNLSLLTGVGGGGAVLLRAEEGRFHFSYTGKVRGWWQIVE